MPSHRCKFPTCTTILAKGTRGYCAVHQASATAQKATLSKHYDQHARDVKAKRFYASKAWQRCRAAKLAVCATCERCQQTFAEHVHHVKPLAKCSYAEKFDHKNLMAVCAACHNALEAIAQRQEPERPFVSGILSLVETAEWVFDADAAERPIRFIEKFCKHYEGEFAGQPFLLADVQKQIVRDIFGWKSRATGHRRFSQVWIEAAIGAGKSPLLAGLGLYGLMADGEAGAQVYSVAGEYDQARVVFDCAKRFIEGSAALAERLIVQQYVIRHPSSKSFWKLISGKGRKAGLRPSMVLADEIHEWPTRELYDSLQGRMAKRQQPLWISATNAGESRASLCWQLHDEAEAVLTGKSRNERLYPVIFAAPKEADPASSDAWRLANPLLGITVKEQKVRDEWVRSEGSPALEARFRRFYLTQWVQGSNKWLSMTRWDACAARIAPETVKGLPLYIGLDLSQGDDLCAAAFVWVAPERFYADARFWLPKETADHYQVKDAIPYRAWAADGHISLLEETTISAAVKARIAADLIEAKKNSKLIAVCFDRYKADDAIAALESAGITCIPIAQGYTISPGCMELERRLKEQSITVSDNPVLRFNAEVVEIKGDDRGNIWPVKPMAKGKYAGRRSQKIDGVTALVTALTEARKHAFPKPENREWKGEVEFL